MEVKLVYKLRSSCGVAPTEVRRTQHRMIGCASSMSRRHRDVTSSHDAAPHPSDPADIPVSTLRVNLKYWLRRHRDALPQLLQMITMLRKFAMVIHLFVWSVCNGKPKGVSRRDDGVCGVRGGPRLV